MSDIIYSEPSLHEEATGEHVWKVAMTRIIQVYLKE
jgi:hypothetical protein